MLNNTAVKKRKEERWVDNDLTPGSSLSAHSGRIRIDLELSKGLANQANRLVKELNVMNGEIQQFEEVHNQMLANIRSEFEEKLNQEFNLLSSADIQEAIADLAVNNSNGPKFYVPEALEELLNYLLITRNDTMDISCFLEAMANQLQRRDELLARWINY
jgi:hypothetical protein